MHKTISEIVKKTGAIPFILQDGNMVYEFTNAAPPQSDYIYLPMVLHFEDVFKKIEEHLKNKSCKGFFISQNLISKKEYLELLYKYQPQNVFVVPNVYVTGFVLASELLSDSGAELIVLCGTDDTESLKKNLSSAFEIDCPCYNNFWQRVVDPVFAIREGQKFVIIETDNSKAKTAPYIAKLKQGAYFAFSKISAMNMSAYGDFETYNEEWLKLLANKPKRIFAFSGDGFVQFPQMDNLVFVDKLQESILKEFNVAIKPVCEAKNQHVTIDKTGSLSSFKKSIRKFLKENPSERKVVIFSKIPDLGKFQNSIQEEIMHEITEEVELLILFNAASCMPFLREKNKKTNIKEFKGFASENLEKTKRLLNLYPKNDIRVLILSKDEVLWNLV